MFFSLKAKRMAREKSSACYSGYNKEDEQKKKELARAVAHRMFTGKELDKKGIDFFNANQSLVLHYIQTYKNR